MRAQGDILLFERKHVNKSTFVAYNENGRVVMREYVEEFYNVLIIQKSHLCGAFCYL